MNVDAAQGLYTNKSRKKLKNTSTKGRNEKEHSAVMSLKSWTLWQLDGFNRSFKC